jgi:LysM repeat protein
MSARRFIAIAVVLAGLTGALAGEKIHEVRPGESASSIAKQYYGTFDRTDLLLRYNGLAGSVIRPGEELRIPYSETHIVRAGDTWSGLAQKYLGRTSAYPTVAALNGVPPSRALQVGQRLVMPVVLELELARGESLSSLSHEFYGTIDLAPILQEFNEIADPRKLSVGQRIAIPLTMLKLRGPGGSATAAARKPPAPVEKPKPTVKKPPPPPPEPLYTREIAAARKAFDEGSFEEARGLLAPLRHGIARSPVAGERRDYWELVAFVHVAFDERAAACSAYQRRGEGALDPDLVSPKIRQILDDCGS